jgi:hypothetical protein
MKNATRKSYKYKEGKWPTNARHFGTGTNRHLCETFRYQDKSALVFFSLILCTIYPDHADSNPDPRSVIDEKKRLILFVSGTEVSSIRRSFTFFIFVWFSSCILHKLKPPYLEFFLCFFTRKILTWFFVVFVLRLSLAD